MKIYLAPMEGITTYIYRNAHNKYFGNIDKYFTPFITNKKLKSRELNEVLPDNNKVENLIPQILGNNPETCLYIISQLKDLGYNEVNLNLGCPSKTVTSKGRGAGMLGDLKILNSFLDNLYSKSELDISIKTRLGIESINEWPDILKIYSNYPIKELTIHARLLNEFYGGSPHIDCFMEAIRTLSIPLTFNGDINDLNSYKNLIDKCPDTKSIMLGRGIIANPNLSTEISQTDILSISNDNSKNNKCNNDSVNLNKSTLNTINFKLFHNEILNNYIDIMPGDTPTLFKMKELWAFWAQTLKLTPKEFKAIRKTKNVKEYISTVESIL